MADLKISELASIPAVASADVLAIVDTSLSETNKVSVEDLLRGAPSGTAAAPSIAFVDDPDTGIFKSGTNELAISTGGTQRVVVDSSGNVGIGTSNPGAELEVKTSGTAASVALRVINDSTGDASMAFVLDGVRAYSMGIDNSDGNKFKISSFAGLGTNDRFVIDSNGNVGIGTSSPGARLEVARLGAAWTGVAPGSGTAAFLHNGNNSTGSPASLQISGGSASSSVIYFGDESDADAGAVEYGHGTNSMKFRVNASERMRIDSAGRLLVGTSSARSNVAGITPYFQLEGANSNNARYASLTFGFNSAAGGGFSFNKHRGSTVGSNTIVQSGDTLGVIDFTGADGTNFIKAASIKAKVNGNPGTNDMPGALLFSTTADGASSPTERMRIDSSGNVGISTTAVVNKLDVNGAVGVKYNEGIKLFRNTAATNNDILVHEFSSGDILNIAPAGNGAASKIVFKTASGSAVAERMRIDDSGRVGIGTSSPSYLLQVNAGTGLDSIRVNGQLNGSSRSLTLGHNASGQAQISAGSAGGADNTLNIFGRPIVFGKDAANEYARIDSSGRLLVGTSADFQSTTFQVAGLGALGGAGNNAFSTALILSKTRGASVSNHTIVQNDDELGALVFRGSDGSSYKPGAFILGAVDGTPGTNDMPGRLVFATNAGSPNTSPSERMRITSGGLVLIGKTGTANAVSTVGYQISSAAVSYQTTDGSEALNLSRKTSNGNLIVFRRGTASAVGSISVTTTTTSYNTSSDYRLKENVVDIADGITRVKQLQPKRFNFIADDTATVDGFLAHEAQTVVPEAVTGEKDAVDDDNNPVYQGIDQSKLVPLLTAALQEAIAKIETLEAKVAALEAG